MATLVIENATVERVFQTAHGWGVRVAEPFTTQNGNTGNNYFTLWFQDQPNLMQGNVIVRAEGRHGAKIRDYNVGEGEARRTIDVSVHDAVILEAAAGGAVAAPAAPSQQTWHMPPASNQEPF